MASWSAKLTLLIARHLVRMAEGGVAPAAGSRTQRPVSSPRPIVRYLWVPSIGSIGGQGLQVQYSPGTTIQVSKAAKVTGTRVGGGGGGLATDATEAGASNVYCRRRGV